MKLKFGMVGGGNDAFIGNVHRIGAQMDNLSVLKAGCFSRNFEKNTETAVEWRVDDSDRIYPDYKTMADRESVREDGIDFVIIATPNDTHYPIAKYFLEKGINVVCDKPLAINTKDGEELARLAKEKDLLFGITYTYTGYAMIKQARDMIERGEIGNIMTVMAEYPQEWLIVQMVSDRSDQATWRMDPARSGPSGCCADIGTHVECLISKMTGLKMKKVLTKFERLPNESSLPLENNVQILAEFDNGASGMIWTSQVAIGHETDLSIRIFGDKGAIEWQHRAPAELKVTKINEPPQLYTPTRDYDSIGCRRLSRLPSGHPEGFFEAFGNIYRGYCSALLNKKYDAHCETFDFPTVEDGLFGLKFVDACIESDQKGNIWVEIE
ncbi:MAG: Gfo/Idh/MocA family protein [Fastidiosipilaceae bacterium]|jgi:predicted dehydrogenase